MKQPLILFDGERASGYDDRYARLAPFKEALHLNTRLVLSKLPSQARVLIVGAGTGAELLYLAQSAPDWHFTVVEPSRALPPSPSRTSLAPVDDAPHHRVLRIFCPTYYSRS